jgi:hypothetical protein
MAVLQKKEKALSSEQPFSRKSGRELFFFLPNPHTSSATLAGAALLDGMGTHREDGGVSTKPASSGNHADRICGSAAHYRDLRETTIRLVRE